MLGTPPHPGSTTLTQPGVLLGTIGYMSPEQVRGRPADPSSDVFAFGAVLYEMLTGTPAFQRDSAADTLSAILNDEPEELEGIEHKMPPALERVVHRCLRKDPEERFRNGRELAFAMEAVAGLTSSDARASAVGASPAEGAILPPGTAARPAVCLARTIRGAVGWHCCRLPLGSPAAGGDPFLSLCDLQRPR